MRRSRASFFGGSFWNTPSWNFSHSRGTEMKTVGCARLRSATNVSSDSAKKSCIPVRRPCNSTTIRSMRCASGR